MRHGRAVAVLIGVSLLASIVTTSGDRDEVAGAAAPSATVWSADLFDPGALTVGPDGALWFPNRNGPDPSIGRSTLGGEMTHFADAGIDDPRDIVVGPDGALWFVNTGQWGVPGNGSIGRVTTGGSFSYFTDPSIGFPTSIVVGADGALWFSTGSGLIGRVTTTGSFAFFPGGGGYFSELTMGSDGALWFPYGDQIGRMAMDGSTSYLPFVGPAPTGPIVEGSDAALWFTAENSIGRMSKDGDYTSYPVAALSLDSISSGADGAVWFTGFRYAGRITTSGIVTLIPMPSGDPPDIVVGPDLKMWTAGQHQLYQLDATSVTRTVVGRVADPTGLAAGPFGEVMLTNRGGSFTTFWRGAVGTTSPAGLELPMGGVTGADRAYWFANGKHGIARLARGRVTTITSSKIAAPTLLAIGPDRKVWFANKDRSIGRINGDGFVARFSISAPARGMVAGLDGAMWFTAGTRIGRVTPDGVVTERNDTGYRQGGQMVRDNSGVIWFADDGAFGRIDRAGNLSHVRVPGIDVAASLAPGTDCALWFIDRRDGRVGRRAASGSLRYFDAGFSWPTMIAPGPDGAMWLANVANVSRLPTPGPPMRPRLSFGDTTIEEGDVWNRRLPINVTLTAPTVTPVSVTGTIGNHSTRDDEVANTQSQIVLLPGETSAVMQFDVVGDGADEPKERFELWQYIHSGNADAGRAVAVGWILDDDPGPAGVRVSVGNARIVEGRPGPRSMRIPVTLSTTATQPVTVQWIAAPGGGANDALPASTGGSVTIAPGVTSAMINVAVRGGSGSRDPRTFQVALFGASGATIGRGLGTATVLGAG